MYASLFIPDEDGKDTRVRVTPGLSVIAPRTIMDLGTLTVSVPDSVARTLTLGLAARFGYSVGQMDAPEGATTADSLNLTPSGEDR